MRVSDLKANPRNPRKISDEKLDMLKRALERFGDLSGIVYNVRSSQLVGGHQRAKQLPPDAEILVERAFEEPTRTGTVAEGRVIVDGESYAYREVSWDADEEKAANIAANKHGGDFELPLLNEFLLELDSVNFDMDLTGFTQKELEDLLAPIDKLDPEEDPDKVYTPSEDPVVKPGDLFLLGEHRLVCGDSTLVEQVDRLMDGEKAQLCFTDPPYGVNYEGGATKRTALANDHSNDIYSDVLPIIHAFTEEKAALYLWHAAGYADIASKLGENGYKIRAQLIWSKNIAQFGAFSAQYKQKHEPCFYCHKKNASPYWYGPNTETTVWEVDRESKNEFHPTQKPTALAERALTNSSSKGDLVLDLFGGSGSTLIACETLGRKARLMEMDPAYCQVILNRWCGYTKKQAHHVAADGTLTDWEDMKGGELPPDTGAAVMNEISQEEK